jgi:hypothetical protein
MLGRSAALGLYPYRTIEVVYAPKISTSWNQQQPCEFLNSPNETILEYTELSGLWIVSVAWVTHPFDILYLVTHSFHLSALSTHLSYCKPRDTVSRCFRFPFLALLRTVWVWARPSSRVAPPWELWRLDILIDLSTFHGTKFASCASPLPTLQRQSYRAPLSTVPLMTTSSSKLYLIPGVTQVYDALYC